jgi:hypothetical protein
LDQKIFEEKLSQLAEWTRIEPREPKARRREPQHDDPSPEIVITKKHYGHDCNWCHRQQKEQVVHVVSYQAATRTHPARWIGRCETCKKKYDPRTGQPTDVVFRKQIHRQPAPGLKLGRPPGPMSDEEKAQRRESIRRRRELENK